MLRGIAALLVAIGHFGEWGAIRLEETFSFCVPFFFMLSGYVLAHAYGDAIAKRALDFRGFVALRVARLYPLHIVTFLAVVAFYASMEVSRLFVTLPVSDAVGLHANLLKLIETMTLTHFLLGQGVSFNTPSWSISIEFWCSFYVFVLCSTRLSRLLKLLGAFAGFAALAAVQVKGGLYGADRYWFGAINTTYLIGVGCFAIGWGLKEIRNKTERIVCRLPRFFYWGLAFATFSFMIFTSDAKIFDSAIYLSFAIMIAGLSGSEVRGEKIKWVMKRAGDLSYGIYLWHMPLTLAIAAVAHIFEKLAGLNLLHTVILDLIYIPALLLIASFSYRLIELPAKVKMRKFLSGTLRSTAVLAK
jgi:peptidoglycan/LPS O-acetylase OafA/YrhL